MLKPTIHPKATHINCVQITNTLLSYFELVSSEKKNVHTHIVKGLGAICGITSYQPPQPLYRVTCKSKTSLYDQLVEGVGRGKGDGSSDSMYNAMRKPHKIQKGSVWY